MLQKVLPPTGVAAEFEDDSMQVGLIKLSDRLVVCLFNWDEVPKTISFKLPGSSAVKDYWSGEDLGRRNGVFEIKDLPPHSARLLECK